MVQDPTICIPNFTRITQILSEQGIFHGAFWPPLPRLSFTVIPDKLAIDQLFFWYKQYMQMNAKLPSWKSQASGPLSLLQPAAILPGDQ